MTAAPDTVPTSEHGCVPQQFTKAGAGLQFAALASEDTRMSKTQYSHCDGQNPQRTQNKLRPGARLLNYILPRLPRIN